jgi:hypothetical protein
MIEDKIQLASCNAFQLTEKGKKGDWLIRENITDEELHRFNGRIPDEDMFEILRFARKYEIIAFNAGITMQKEHQCAALQAENDQLRADLGGILARNEELASAVERLSRGDN